MDPYLPLRSSVPAAVASPGLSKADRFQLIASLLIAAFCTLQFWGVLLVEMRMVSDFGLPLSSLFVGMLRSGALFLAGLFLVFQRKLATYLFAAYVLYGLLTLPEEGRSGVVLSLLLIAAFLAYCLHLHKAGKLR